MDPVSILKQVRAKYSEIDAYADSGTVSQEIKVGEMPYTIRTDFSTYFIKPDKVRFEWQNFGAAPDMPGSHEREAFWSDGEYCWKTYMGQLKRPATLPMAMAGATGVSQGAVNHILHLLIPNVLQLRWFWCDMTEARLVGEVEANGFTCFHIVGTTKDTDDVEAFISKDDFAVRRIVTTLTITRESREESYKFALENAAKKGILAEALDEMRKQLALSISDETKIYVHRFDYSQVELNGKISQELFGG